MIEFSCPFCYHWHNKDDFEYWMQFHYNDYDGKIPQSYEEMKNRFVLLGLFEERVLNEKN